MRSRRRLAGWSEGGFISYGSAWGRRRAIQGRHHDAAMLHAWQADPDGHRNPQRCGSRGRGGLGSKSPLHRPQVAAVLRKLPRRFFRGRRHDARIWCASRDRHPPGNCARIARLVAAVVSCTPSAEGGLHFLDRGLHCPCSDSWWAGTAVTDMPLRSPMRGTVMARLFAAEGLTAPIACTENSEICLLPFAQRSVYKNCAVEAPAHE